MIIIAVITIRLHSRTRGRHLSRSGSDTDGRLSQSSHSGYCTTISSDVAEIAMDGYHPLSRKQKPQKLIVKEGETYIPISGSCDSSCVLAECDYSPAISDKLIHTPPPQYRGTSLAVASGGAGSSSGQSASRAMSKTNKGNGPELDNGKTFPFESRC